MERKTIKPKSTRPEPEPSLEELAAQQGVQPVTDFDALLGHPSVEDETVEEFAAMLREWRGDVVSSVRPQ